MPDVPSVVVAFSRAMAEVQSVAKNDRNSAQNFNFRGIDSVVNAVGPALRKHGVVVLPQLLDLQQELREVGDRGKHAFHATVKVRYTFVGPAGDTLEATVPGEAMDYGDKVIAKAMSVAWRICLLQSFTIPTDEPDPDATVYEVAAPTRIPPPRERPAGTPAEKLLNPHDVAKTCFTTANLSALASVAARIEGGLNVDILDDVAASPDLLEAVGLAEQAEKDNALTIGALLTAVVAWVKKHNAAVISVRSEESK